jgi:hypothetical protein
VRFLAADNRGILHLLEALWIVEARTYFEPRTVAEQADENTPVATIHLTPSPHFRLCRKHHSIIGSCLRPESTIV